MSYYFNTNFLDRLQAGTSFATSVVVYLFEQAPAFDVEEPPTTGMLAPTYASIDFPSQLEQQLGWGHAIRGPVVATTQTLGGDSKYVSTTATFDLVPGFPSTNIRALVFCEDIGTPSTDQIMFATNTPLVGGGMVINNWDSILAQEDTTTTTNMLFSWTEQVDPTPQTAKEGNILILKGAPPFDVARTQHVWVYPQRVNYICNPSFEVLNSYWRSSGTIAMTSPAPPGAGPAAGRVSGTSPLILESNYFPLAGRRREPGWTIQLQIREAPQDPATPRPASKLKVALLAWEDDFAETFTDWGLETEEWTLGSGFTHIRTMRRTGELAVGQLRIEVVGTTPYFEIDQVCAEPGLLPTNGVDWPYFDGDSLYENDGDYSWYGQPAWAGGTYSCWYNFRYPTFGRMFAQLVDSSEPSPNAVFTEVDEAQQGSIYQWVPAGTQVSSHLDVLYPGDPRNRPIVLNPLTVHPYKDPVDPDTTPLGVVPPTWR